MSKAKAAFESSIKDAEDLLDHLDRLANSPSGNGEVLKRAGLIMASTAWETYVEDRVQEAVDARLHGINGSFAGKFVLGKLDEELRRFNNPNTEKTRKLFRDFLEVDVTTAWEWQHFNSARAQRILDELIAKRGEVAHRSKRPPTGVPSPGHVVKREYLEKSIHFLKCLVDATERALAEK